MSQFPFSISGTELYEFVPAAGGDPYQISVAYPEGYHQAGEHFPALYVLDANMFFGTVVEAYRALRLAQAVPAMVIIGIGYPSFRTDIFVQRRTRDFTPTVSAEAERMWRDGHGIETSTGGAGQFLALLRDEMLPFIENHVWVQSDDRALWGFSYGALFALYTLFHENSLFSRYWIGSPSMVYDQGVVERYEAAYAQQNRDLAAQVCFTIGELEENDGTRRVTRLTEFCETLKKRAYTSFHQNLIVMTEEDHFSVATAALPRGLRQLYTQPVAP